MKIILLDKVFKLGYVGSKVNVKVGYALNQLIPKGISMFNVFNNIKYFKKKLIKNLFNNKVLLINFHINCNNNGNLFGSINCKKIMNIIKKYNINIKKKNICKTKIIKNIGNYIVKIKINNNFKVILFKILKKN
ncbi:MAG: 50S ribosomal protein L9 [Enterobacteriaceae bacterium PSpicST2]|nr:MAG: 50S ribosomal protein L9 [Enterobacteriaceae bacterium PSpicST2]